MTAPKSVLIVGGGMGGFTVAKELRDRGFAGELTIVDPLGVPYDRPPLSKDYLLGKKSAEGLQFAGADWYEDNKVTLVTAKVTALEPNAPAVTLDNGTTLEADKIVIATGGSPRLLNVPGTEDNDTVLTLRTIEDADRLRSLLSEGSHLVIVGAGLIGAEVASSALTFGAKVTLIDPTEVPLVPAVGETLARRLHDMHGSAGIRVIQGLPTSIEKEGDQQVVHTSTGETVPADVILVGIGIIPNVDFALEAGLEVDNGIIVDTSQRTAHPNVYAVGDGSRTRNEEGILERRAEHWEHAMNTGATAAAALLGQDLPVHGASWFWSDRHGVHVEGVGSMVGGENCDYVYREVEGLPQTAFYMDADGKMLGCASIDGGLTVRAARRIIDRGILVDRNQLADASIPLKKLAR